MAQPRQPHEQARAVEIIHRVVEDLVRRAPQSNTRIVFGCKRLEASCTKPAICRRTHAMGLIALGSPQRRMTSQIDERT